MDTIAYDVLIMVTPKDFRRRFPMAGNRFIAISFEKEHFVREYHRNLFDNKLYQAKLTARQMLEIAIHLGARLIDLVGMDLVYPTGKAYASGIMNEKEISMPGIHQVY